MPSVDEVQAIPWPTIDASTIQEYRRRLLAPPVYEWSGKGICLFNGSAMGCRVKGLRSDASPAYRPIYQIHWDDGVLQTIWLGSDISAFVGSNNAYAFGLYSTNDSSGAAMCSVRTSTNNTTVFPCVTNMSLWVSR